jgi:flagellar biosynthesis/type III secretory pathway chaperone
MAVVDDVTGVLHEEERVMHDLLGALEREHNALVDNDVPRISSLVNEKEALLAAFAGLESSRRRLLAPLGQEPSLSDLAKSAGSKGAGLFQQRERLMDLSSAVQMALDRNRSLYQQGMACAQAILEALRHPQGRASVYGPSAAMQDEPSSAVFQVQV